MGRVWNTSKYHPKLSVSRGEPKLSDCFVNEIFRKLLTSHVKFDIQEIPQPMKIDMVLDSYSIYNDKRY